MTTSVPKSRFTLLFRRYSMVIGFLILIGVVSQVDVGEMISLAGAVPLSSIAIAGLAYAVNVLLKAWRWHRMVGQLGVAMPLQVSVSAFLSGALYGMVTIGRLGELLRVEALTGRISSRARALSTCLADRVLDLAFLGAIACVGSAQAFGVTFGGLALGLVLLGLVLFVAIGRLLRARHLPRAAADAAPSDEAAAGLSSRALARLLRLAGGAREVLVGIADLLLAPRAVESLAWTALSWAGYFAAVAVLAEGLGYQVPLSATVSATAIAAASSALPISFQGIGTREAVFAFVLGPYGVSVTQAATLSLSLLTLLYVVTVPLGLLGVWWRKRQLDGSAAATS